MSNHAERCADEVVVVLVLVALVALCCLPAPIEVEVMAAAATATAATGPTGAAGGRGVDMPGGSGAVAVDLWRRLCAFWLGGGGIVVRVVGAAAAGAVGVGAGIAMDEPPVSAVSAITTAVAGRASNV